MIRIGLTGGLCSGKSTALKILQELGCHTISADDINHELMKTNKALIAKLKTEFNCVDDKGIVNRKLLGKIVFNDKKAKEKLEMLTHPLVKLVRKDFFKNAEANGCEFAVCETPLLFEKDLMQEFDYSIVIVSSLENRIDRFIAKGSTQERFFEITKNQLLDGKKTKMADFIIKNNGTKYALKQTLSKTLKDIREKHYKKF